MTEAQPGGHKPPGHVFFAMPSYSGTAVEDTVQSLENARDLLTSRGWDVTVAVIKGDCYVQRARNDLAHAFLKSKATDLFFIDDDVGFEAQDAVRLLEMDDDIVFGVYPKKCNAKDFPIVIHTHSNGRPRVRDDGAIYADIAPAGFLRIKRAALERIRFQSPHLSYEHYEGGELIDVRHDFFPQGVQKGRWVGEDAAFCWLAQKSFFSIMCVPDITLRHHARDGSFMWAFSYHDYLLRLPGGSHEGVEWE